MDRMISHRLGRMAAGVVAASAMLGDAASAGTGGRNCFMVNDWHGWSSPSPDVLYLAVNFRDVYKVELAQPVEGLNLMDTVLISDEQGPSSVCGPVDLRLIMTHHRGGGRQGLIVRSLTRLTPEEIAAIHRKFRPS